MKPAWMCVHQPWRNKTVPADAAALIKPTQASAGFTCAPPVVLMAPAGNAGHPERASGVSQSHPNRLGLRFSNSARRRTASSVYLAKWDDLPFDESQAMRCCRSVARNRGQLRDSLARSAGSRRPHNASSESRFHGPGPEESAPSWRRVLPAPARAPSTSATWTPAVANFSATSAPVHRRR